MLDLRHKRKRVTKVRCTARIPIDLSTMICADFANAIVTATTHATPWQCRKIRARQIMVVPLQLKEQASVREH